MNTRIPRGLQKHSLSRQKCLEAQVMWPQNDQKSSLRTKIVNLRFSCTSSVFVSLNVCQLVSRISNLEAYNLQESVCSFRPPWQILLCVTQECMFGYWTQEVRFQRKTAIAATGRHLHYSRSPAPRIYCTKAGQSYGVMKAPLQFLAKAGKNPGLSAASSSRNSEVIEDKLLNILQTNFGYSRWFLTSPVHTWPFKT